MNAKQFRTHRLARVSHLVPAMVGGAAVVGLAVFAHQDDPKIFDALPPVFAPAYRAAEGGLAGAPQFEAEGVILMSWLPLNEFGNASSGNDCWGYVSPSGREYALIGVRDATGFVEITNPADAQVVALIPGPTSLWRDVKVYGHHAYVVTEGGGGIQVVDMSAIDDGIVTLVNTVGGPGTGNTHNVAINEESGYLYRCGGGNNGLRIYSLANPASPQYVGQWQDRYVHDAQIVNWTTGPYAGREIAFCCAGFNGGWGQTGLSIVDVTDKSNPVTLAHLEYPQAAYSHQGWLSECRQYFFLGDELDETEYGLTTTVHVIDVSDLEKPFEATTFTNGSPAITHNMYTRDGRLYSANYRSGMRIFDVGDPLNAVEVAWFDTFPANQNPNFNGLWSVFPYFPSGTVIGSDLERGLFVWYVGAPPLSFEFPEGLPTLVDPAGMSLTVKIVAESPLAVAEGSPKMHLLSEQGTEAISLVPLGKDLYRADFPALPCGSLCTYSFSAQSSNGLTLPGPSSPVSAVVAISETELFHDDMEKDTGWIAGLPTDTATSGHWERAEPIGTIAAPHEDNPAGEGTFAYITENGVPGGPAGAADVDNGITTLISPTLDAIGGANDSGVAFVEYYRWYSNNMGANPNSDSMPISISNDDGETWTLLEDVTENAGAWVRKRFRIDEFVEPTKTIRLRFVARDLDPQALVEAGVDDVRIMRYSCEATTIVGDLNGDGIVNGADLGILLQNWGNPGVGDLDGNGTVDGADLGILLGNWTR